MYIYLVQHLHETEDYEDVKVIGVFSSSETAERAIEACRQLPGFKDAPEGFSIDKYELDRAEWREGFVTAD